MWTKMTKDDKDVDKDDMDADKDVDKDDMDVDKDDKG